MSKKTKNQKNNNIHDKLVADININITTRLSDLMSKLLNSAQEKLFTLSDEADNNEDQTRYFELMNQIRVLKTSIADSFNQNIKEYLVPAIDYKPKNKKNDDDGDGELSLVAQDDMEGIVLVKGIGERSGAKYREQLSHLEARLDHLSLKTNKLFKTDALFPMNFCQAFDDALSDDFDNTNKKLLFSMFDVEIANKLDALYDSINNRLIDADILPQIKLNMPGNKRSSRPSNAAPEHTEENIADDNQQGDFGDGGYQGGGMQPGGHGAGGAPQGGGPASGAGAQAGGNFGGGASQGGGMQPSGHGAGGAPQGGGPASGAGAQAGGNFGGGASQGGGMQPGGHGAGGAPQGEGPASGAGAQAGDTSQGGGSSNIGGFAMAAAPGGTYNRAGQNAQQAPGGDGNVSGGASSGGASDGGSAGGSQGGDSTNQSDSTNSSAASGEYQHYTAGMPANRVGRVLGNYIGGAPFTPGTAGESSGQTGDFYPASTNQHFGHQEIIQALSNLQSQPQFESPEETRFDGEAIKQAVLAEIAKTSGGAVTKRINQIAEKTIDFIELIFDAIIDDEDISDAIKALLLRLQIPVIKASMSDQEFFIYDDHPARVLLDTIADVGVGVTDHTDDMYKLLDKTVSSILGEYELKTETFQAALDMLNAYIEEQEAITRAQEEEAQQQILRKHARATVLRALRATTTGKTLPEAVHPLILKRWPTLMFNHYMAKGKENNEWVNIVLTLRHIVDSVQPITSAEHLAKLMSEKDLLLKQTETYLNSSSNSKKDVQSIMADYIETLQDHIDDANYTEEEVSVAEEIVSQAEPVEEAPLEEETIDRQEMPANVMPGMWFQVYMGEDSIPRRCKLSVIIVEDFNLMFVNHKGELVVEKSFDEFNKELANETSKMIMGHSAFDHAFKSVIDRLN